MFSKKKKNITFEEQYYNKKAEKSSVKKELSLAEDIKNFKWMSFLEKTFFNTKRWLKFPAFSSFVDTLTDVINNYKNKPWFSKADALRMVWEKLKNKTIISLSASLWNKDQVLVMLKETEDKMYYQFQEVILETSLDKTLEMLKIMENYIKTKNTYQKVFKNWSDTLMFYFLWYLLWLLQWLSIVYMEITQEMIPLDVFLSKWEDQLSLFFVTPIIAFMWIENNLFLSIQYVIEIFIIFILPIFIFYYLFVTINQYMVDKNIRSFDKYWNEYNYVIILKIKIIQMKLWKDRYQKTNYFLFLKNIWLICYKRGLMNIDYYKDFNKLLQIFETIQKVVSYKEVPNLTELFYINFVNILEAYKWYITGSVKNFNLWYIYNRFDNIQPIIGQNVGKGVEKYSTIKAIILLFITLWIWWYTWFLQVDGMDTIIGMMRN